MSTSFRLHKNTCLAAALLWDVCHEMAQTAQSTVAAAYDALAYEEQCVLNAAEMPLAHNWLLRSLNAALQQRLYEPLKANDDLDIGFPNPLQLSFLTVGASRGILRVPTLASPLLVRVTLMPSVLCVLVATVANANSTAYRLELVLSEDGKSVLEIRRHCEWSVMHHAIHPLRVILDGLSRHAFNEQQKSFLRDEWVSLGRKYDEVRARKARRAATTEVRSA